MQWSETQKYLLSFFGGPDRGAKKVLFIPESGALFERALSEESKTVFPFILCCVVFERLEIFAPLSPTLLLISETIELKNSQRWFHFGFFLV